jgi:hypothetical protein
LALRYNDKSVLESYHIAEALKLAQKGDEFNIFKNMKLEDSKNMRKRMIDCVLATDMSFHA